MTNQQVQRITQFKGTVVRPHGKEKFTVTANGHLIKLEVEGRVDVMDSNYIEFESVAVQEAEALAEALVCDLPIDVTVDGRDALMISTVDGYDIYLEELPVMMQVDSLAMALWHDKISLRF